MVFRPRSGMRKARPQAANNGAKPGGSPESRPEARATFDDLKSRLHQTLINRLDLSVLISVDRDVLSSQIGQVTQTLLEEEGIFLAPETRDKLIGEIQNEILGLGPLEQYMSRPEVSDILVNGYDKVYIEEKGKLYATETQFKDNAHLMKIIDRIVTRIGRRLDEASPMVDARLQDGSRVNAIIPPLALDGPMLSIRRFRTNVLSIDDLLEEGSIVPPVFEFLKASIKAKLNLVISGGTGAGKTTLLNILSAYIPDDERIITIEDSAELQLQQPHVVRLETRPPNIEGRGLVTQRDLLRNALRMRPDRIIIGEVRGNEIYDMLQAMNTGHDGSLTTIHANSTRDCLLRLETLMLLTGIEIPGKAIRELISSSINMVVQVSRYSDGTRRVSSISEVVGMEQTTITTQEIFRFEKLGIEEDGTVRGQFRSTGIRPKAINRFKAAGINLPTATFDSFEDAA
jgi:pilus assembly protein CpaF